MRGYRGREEIEAERTGLLWFSLKDSVVSGRQDCN